MNVAASRISKNLDSTFHLTFPRNLLVVTDDLRERRVNRYGFLWRGEKWRIEALPLHDVYVMRGNDLLRDQLLANYLPLAHLLTRAHHAHSKCPQLLLQFE